MKNRTKKSKNLNMFNLFFVAYDIYFIYDFKIHDQINLSDFIITDFSSD